MGMYNVYPTGTTIYDKKKAWNGYTVFHAFEGAVIIDMNGNLVHEWKGLNGSPSRLLPGGTMIGTLKQPTIAARFDEGGQDLPKPDLDSEEMVEADWNGKIIWRKKTAAHHDFQIEGNTVGYPCPGQVMNHPAGSRMLILENYFAHMDNYIELDKDGKTVLDDCISEYDEHGEIIWSWRALDHMDEFELTAAQKAAAYRTGDDWCHLNAVNVIGENKAFDDGNPVFAPENLIVSSRELSMIFIIRKADGKIIWKQGPAEVQERLGKAKAKGRFGLEKDDPGLFIGQHHVHVIPRGLPGEGNILMYDNGGFAGYGEESLTAPDGRRTLLRHYSRILEIDPQTWKTVWEYRFDELEITAGNFFSPLLGCAQRLENGNTLVTEGVFGRIMEIAQDKEIVWEYVSDQTSPFKIMGSRSIIYRAYRVPYDFVPMLPHPKEVSLPKIDNYSYHVPGSYLVETPDSEKVELH